MIDPHDVLSVFLGFCVGMIWVLGNSRTPEQILQRGMVVFFAAIAGVYAANQLISVIAGGYGG